MTYGFDFGSNIYQAIITLIIPKNQIRMKKQHAVAIYFFSIESTAFCVPFLKSIVNI